MTDLQNEDMIETYALGDGLHAEEARETERSFNRFIWAMWIAVAMLLVLNSGQLVTYVNGFDVGPVRDAVVSLSTGWDAQMEKAGASRLSAYVHEQVNLVRSMSWDEIKALLDEMSAKDAAQLLRGMLNDTDVEAASLQAGRS